MAEFVEVIQKKEEMCNYCDVCGACPLGSTNNPYGIGCESLMTNFPQKAEEIIMTWIHPIDWSNVEIDTPILVRRCNKDEWEKRYFAKYDYGDVFAWKNGKTSWSADSKYDVAGWEYAKLAEEEER